MTSSKPIASLSLDLDNQWSYMKTHGDAGWEAFPSYLDVVVPRVLDFLRQRNLTITFFIVGQDAALDKNREALARIAAAGHEIGNHSFHHEPWLHLYSPEEIDREIARAEESIARIASQRLIGFRGPGYSCSPDVLRVLIRRGYQYDASTFPTFLGPLARAYYFMTSKLSADERAQRAVLFGRLQEGLRPLKSYRWQTDAGQIVEIPVTTMPIFKIPIHVSYLLYLANFSRPLARCYFDFSLCLCRLTRTPLSLLLHPLDFLGADDVRELAFFPGMNQPSERKVELVGQVLDNFARFFRIGTMAEHAAAVQAGRLPTIAATARQFPAPPPLQSKPAHA